MKELLFTLSFITLVYTGSAQNTDLPSCKKPEDNKTIHLCNLKSDTLTYVQFSTCDQLITTDTNATDVIAFVLHYFLSDKKTMREFKSKDGRITPFAIESILKDKPSYILFEEIIGTGKKGSIILGHKKFHLYN